MRKPRRKGGTLKDGERRQLARTSRHGAREPVPVAGSDRPVLLCDGGSRGNPGTAACAAVLVLDGDVIDQRTELLGHASAADAEYRAILLGLTLASDHGLTELEVRSDSQLAIAALRSATPAPGLIDDVRAAAAAFTVRWTWHPREANELADALVRELLWP